MPITLLDIILLVVMAVSALLAMVRGFMREVLSIASWIAAAAATLAQQELCLRLDARHYSFVFGRRFRVQNSIPC